MTNFALGSNPGFPNIKECLYFLAVCGVTVACLAAWWIYKLYLKKRTQRASTSVEDEGSDEMENPRLRLTSTNLADESQEQSQSPEGDVVQQPSRASPLTKVTLKMISPHCKQVSTGIISAAHLETKVSNAQSFASNFIWAATLTMGVYIIYKLSNEPASGNTGFLQLQ